MWLLPPGAESSGLTFWGRVPHMSILKRPNVSCQLGLQEDRRNGEPRSSITISEPHLLNPSLGDRHGGPEREDTLSPAPSYS